MAASRPLLGFLRQHLFAAVCLFLALVAGALYGLRFGLLSQAEEEVAQLAKERDAIVRNLRQATGLPDQLNRLNEALKRIDERLVRAEDLARNLQYFYRLENETGVKLVLVRQGASSGTPARTAYSPVSYSVILEGSFSQALAFLGQLENGPHFSRISTFTAQRGAVETAEGLRSGTVVLNLNVELLGSP